MSGLVLSAICAALVFGFGYYLGHEVGWSKGWWERTKDVDRLLGRAADHTERNDER